MGKSVKSSGAVSMIRRNDGPTSIFIGGKGKKTVKQRVHKFLYKIRKAWIEKHLKPDPHNMDEVMSYIKNQYGFMECQWKTLRIKQNDMRMSCEA